MCTIVMKIIVLFENIILKETSFLLTLSVEHVRVNTFVLK